MTDAWHGIERKAGQLEVVRLLRQHADRQATQNKTSPTKTTITP